MKGLRTKERNRRVQGAMSRQLPGCNGEQKAWNVEHQRGKPLERGAVGVQVEKPSGGSGRRDHEAGGLTLLSSRASQAASGVQR